MRTARLHEGDVVEADVRGRVFAARVVDLHPRGWSREYLEIEAIRPGARGYRFVTRRQVKRRLSPSDQLELGVRAVISERRVLEGGRR